MNWTLDELNEALKKNPALSTKDDLSKLPKEQKYHNQPQTIDGHYFPSTAEANRYCELKMLIMAGEVREIELQPSFEISKKMRYTPDFKVVYADGRVEYEEVKGFWSEAAKIRVKLFREKYPELVLKIIINGEVVE